jgi:hypothetical protein
MLLLLLRLVLVQAARYAPLAIARVGIDVEVRSQAGGVPSFPTHFADLSGLCLDHDALGSFLVPLSPVWRHCAG